ncbi:MAG: hypothetical protein NT169_19785 [Chloroflexi bacterium]|nr:hypothetical protein [Chloroflexota bacterium]
MILDFKLTTNRDTIRVDAPQVELVTEMRNIVGCLGPNHQIVAIGDTAEDIKRNAPAYWERNGKQIEFVHPFNFEGVKASAGQFEPLIAARVVQWCSDKAFQRMKRESLKRMLLSPWVDRVDYDLQLDGYDKLPPETRREFERYLKKLLVAVRRLQINGKTIPGGKAYPLLDLFRRRR